MVRTARWASRSCAAAFSPEVASVLSLEEGEGDLSSSPSPPSDCLFSVAKGSLSGVSVAPDNFLPRAEFVRPGGPVGPLDECRIDAARFLKLRSIERRKRIMF